MIHPTAVISDSATIADDVEIGPFTIIGDHVDIGGGTRIESHVVVKGPTKIGRNNSPPIILCIFSGSPLFGSQASTL